MEKNVYTIHVYSTDMGCRIHVYGKTNQYVVITICSYKSLCTRVEKYSTGR